MTTEEILQRERALNRVLRHTNARLEEMTTAKLTRLREMKMVCFDCLLTGPLWIFDAVNGFLDERWRIGRGDNDEDCDLEKVDFPWAHHEEVV